LWQAKDMQACQKSKNVTIHVRITIR
jgi:hypothetical protein